MALEKSCTNPSCFFCMMKDPDSTTRRASIKSYLKILPFIDDQDELILVVSGLWNLAMTQPDDQELPSLGIFECMATLINKAIHDRDWLLIHQNIYIPYYAAHIIGSYTLTKVSYAVRAVDSGVVPSLLELLRGKMSWVEQRVAVRALGHLASYEKTFEAVAVYEDEVVRLAMDLASSSVEVVYKMFVGVENRLRYHCDLLTRGAGGVELENRKAEEWASQLQCWSIHLLNCFAIKGRSLDVMCKIGFLEDLSEMWGGLVNHTSPAGVGLIRILCYSKIGREKVSKSRYVIENLCRLSRSCDDWQYIGIDCLLLLLKDQGTRYRVIEIATLYLVDLVELRSLGNRENVGESITKTLVYDYDYKHRENSKTKSVSVRRALEEIWFLKIERRRREQTMSNEKLDEKRVIAKLIKQEGNRKFVVGEIKEALLKYIEALEIWPSRHGNERIVLYADIAQCYLMLRDADSAISYATKALCLCSPPIYHANSLWIRSQAYDIKGMAKESLMDCIMFISFCMKSKTDDHRVKFPYYAVRMISKQMELTWLFRGAQMKASNGYPETAKGLKEHGKSSVRRGRKDAKMMRLPMDSKSYNISGLSTILEETSDTKGIGSGRKKHERNEGRNQSI